jgi:lysophospholipase L1-like esterase
MEDFKKKGQNLLLSVLTVFITFVVLEGAMRIWINHLAGERRFLKYASLRQLQKKKQIKPRYMPHRYLGHALTPNYVKGENKHNALGYRSDEIPLAKPKGQYRIVCMGGSTTYTTEVENYRKSYPYLLEEKLKEAGYTNVQVINAGVGSWTTWESLINFETRILELEPDMIIIYHSVNDILLRLVWPPEAYCGDNSGSINPVKMAMPSIFEYSTLLRYMMIRLGMIKPHSSIDRQLDSTPSTYYAAEFHNQKVKHTYPDGIFKTVSAKEMLAANPPKYFRRNLEHILLIAHYRKIKTVLATFAYSPLFKDEPAVASEEFISAFDEMTDVVQSVAREMDAHLFDFANVFPVDKRYYADGLHVSEEGAILKARLFAEYIIENKLIPSSQGMLQENRE